MRRTENGHDRAASDGRTFAMHWIVVALCALGATPALGTDPPSTISTVAGGNEPGDGGPATVAWLRSPDGVAVDASGNILIADQGHHRIRKVSPDGTISTVTGIGVAGFSGDGGAATSATLRSPNGVAVDASGNIFIADQYNHRIRRVSPDGTISTVAGGGHNNPGDGGPATDAELNLPGGVAVDASGNILIADTSNHRIRRVSPDGTISTVAGTGVAGFSGDGGSATDAALKYPNGVAVDASGNIFIADRSNQRIRRVSPDGTISTVAATGEEYFYPHGVAVDASGNILIADTLENRIRKVSPDGTIATVAGTGVPGFTGDGGPATNARLKNPSGVAVDASGNILIADTGNSRIRRVSDGTISTVAGAGERDSPGDGRPATSAEVTYPLGVAVDAAGNILIAAQYRIQRVSPDGTISTVAGGGNVVDFTSGTGSATVFQLGYASGVAVDEAGNILIADSQRSCIWKVSPDGMISAFAGPMWPNLPFFSGDGGPATDARLNYPHGVAVDGSGNVLIADTLNNRIRRVSPDGTISTVAGGGNSSDNGVPATSASLSRPKGVAVDAAGNILIAETGRHRIRRVSPDGTISTVAGTGVPSFSGDGGPATDAQFNTPGGVAVDASGSILIADTENHRIRRVSPDGTISTVAGTGVPSFSGDGGPATDAQLNTPGGVTVDASGSILIADTLNYRIRKVSAVPPSSIAAPEAIAQECDSDDGGTVLFVFDVTPGPADLLRARDVTGGRTLLELANPVQQQYGIGPVLFPHGASTVVIELLQGTNVLASASVSVQIDDTTAPVLAGCEPQTIELQGPLTALTAALLGVTAADSCDPAPAISFAPEALPLGVTSVTATARDASGNPATGVFDVTVVDTTPPVFTVMPDDVTRECAQGGALVSFDVLAQDLSGTVAIACEDDEGNAVDPHGTLFHVGTHTVTCTASDPSGNTATWSFHVTVVDTVAPVIVCPDDITVGNEPGECFAYVAFSVTATDECDPDVPIASEAPWGPVASGDAFPCGTTAVTCTARDHSGNAVSGTFQVTVEDREAPVFQSPATATLVTDCAGAPLAIAASDLGVTATDNCDVDPAVTCSPALLAPGTTEVTCTARDDDGNEATSVVSVTVLKGPLECRFLRPLDNNVDNVIQPRRTVPVKVRVTCDNVFDPAATATIDEIVQLDGGGTPVGNEIPEDAGASSDGGHAMRLDSDGECYVYNLSTAGWPATSGARFRVTVRVRKSGHADALCEVVLRNK